MPNLDKLFNNSIGFDSIFNRLYDEPINYPPYNIVQESDTEYTITLALAGFTEDDVSIEQRKNRLVVKGSVSTETKTYIHRGIGKRSFERTFFISDHVEVTSASMENGLLNISLVKNIPEELQPKRIEIQRKRHLLVE